MGGVFGRHGLHDLLGAIYAIDGTEEVWLAGVLEAARPLIDDGLGCGLWTFHANANAVVIGLTVENSPLPLRAMGIELASKEPELVRRGHLGPPVATFSEAVGRKNLRDSLAMGSVNR